MSGHQQRPASNADFARVQRPVGCSEPPHDDRAAVVARSLPAGAAPTPEVTR